MVRSRKRKHKDYSTEATAQYNEARPNDDLDVFRRRGSKFIRPNIVSGQLQGRTGVDGELYGFRDSKEKRTPQEPPRKSRGSPRGQRSSRAIRKEPFLSYDYVRQHMPYPNKDQYPVANPDLFGPEITPQLHNLMQKISKLETRYVNRHPDGFRCTVRTRLSDGRVVSADGDGATKRDSNRAACAHFLSKLHQTGILEELYAYEILDPQTYQVEANAKADVYNYAARFGSVPTIRARNVETPLRTKFGRLVEVTIEMPEHGINVSARGADLNTADIAASVKFKEAAEKYFAEHGNGSMVIKDMAAFHSKQVKDFVDFYKARHHNATLDIVTKPVTAFKVSGGAIEAQVIRNGVPIADAVTMTGKKLAEEIAYLVAAVTLMRDDPSLKEDFLQAIVEGGGAYLKPVKPIPLEIDHNMLDIMDDTLAKARQRGLPERIQDVVADEEATETRRTRQRRFLNEEETLMRNRVLKESLEAMKEDPAMANIFQKRNDLPMTQYRELVLEQTKDNLYGIIVGATGSGKTTQVPQIILEDAIMNGRGAECNVICTQPRRIAATSVAARVAQERNERLKETVGYQVRFDAKLPKPGGSITYCTTGILLQQLQHNPDETLDGTSHIIVDEVHERDIFIDFLMILLKSSLQARREEGKSVPRVILMSATIDSELFAKYFEQTTEDGRLLPCPSLSVPGRTFPVEEKYLDNVLEEIEEAHGSHVMRFAHYPGSDTLEYLELEKAFKPASVDHVDAEDEGLEATIDWKRERGVNSNDLSSSDKEESLVPVRLVALTIAHLAKTTTDGAILAFLPGYDEIKSVKELLEKEISLGVDFHDERSFKLYVLHSSVSAADQSSVFAKAPDGCRKIILSTNIAETSVTIPDVQYVVDTGKLREKRYDQSRRITKLQCTWISRSNAKQRAGRAGRVQNGNYYALYSRARFNSLRAIGLPELLRSDLQEVCLDIKAQAFKTPIREFLAQAIEPPTPEAVHVSVENLIGLQAFTRDEELTSLGRLLASLPVHPSLGKMIVLGVIFRCLDPMIVLGAANEERSLFAAPPDARREARAAHSQFIGGSSSDHIALLNAFNQMRLLRDNRGDREAYKFALDNFLHPGAFNTIKSSANEIESVLIDSGLIPFTPSREREFSRIGNMSLNQNSSNEAIIKALIVGGFHPNLALCLRHTWRTGTEKNILLHPSSVNYIRKKKSTDNQHDYNDLLTFGTMTRSSDGKQLLIRDTTSISPIMAFLFGGRSEVVDNVLEVDGWLPFSLRGGDRVGKNILSDFKHGLDRVLTAAFKELSMFKYDKVTSHGADQSKISGGEKAATRSANDAGRRYLADDFARTTFATGLIDLLELEAETINRAGPKSRGGVDHYEPDRTGRRQGRMTGKGRRR